MSSESERCAQAYVDHGVRLGEAGQPEAALACFDGALQWNPESAMAHANRGNALLALGRNVDALDSLEQALSIAPGDATTWSNRGVALHRLEAYAQATESFAQALRIAPDMAQAHCNCGLSWLEQGQPERAIDHYEQALALQPDLAEARWNRGIAHLQRGDFAQGWPDYAARWNTQAYQAHQRHWSFPEWDGRAALHGKTLLLTGEQGVGDTLQFCRFTHLLAQRGAHITLYVQAGLERLLAQLPGVAACCSSVQDHAVFDFHYPLLSLPLAQCLDADPQGFLITNYLRTEPIGVATWRQHLQTIATGTTTSADAPRVGLVWRGNPQHPHDRRRSLSLNALLSALPSDLHYFSLQKDLTPEESLALRAARIADCGGLLGDFADTAAVCENLDCIVSVDTAVAHLAGALGRPVWLLLPAVADWRWQLERSDSPWYPRMELLRQSHPGDWHGVLHTLQTRLTARAGRC